MRNDDFMMRQKSKISKKKIFLNIFSDHFFGTFRQIPANSGTFRNISGTFRYISGTFRTYIPKIENFETSKIWTYANTFNEMLDIL